jgi:selenide,water dikinase
LAPGALAQVLGRLNKQLFNPNVLVGYENADDAGVYRLRDDLALVHTVDFFTPIVDNPADYGRIAALNALNDVWVMGGTPLTAMAVACFPKSGIDNAILSEIMNGGMDILVKNEVALVGGHTVDNQQILFGYAITGTIDPRKIATNTGARPGDVVILTKPLGTGIISTAVKFGEAAPEVAEASLSAMLTPGRAAATVIQLYGLRAATDVTGFGFLGHSLELARASGITIEYDSATVPSLKGALDLAAQGIYPGGTENNREYVGDSVSFAKTVSIEMRHLLFDPQTAGGFLLCVPAEDAPSALSDLRPHYADAAVIGRVREKGEHWLVVN